ncbi:AhpC/TSA family protein [Mucilaginibacter sp. BJC16-A38]|uniref:AhpC/TSA family protein n=1 Tax=Mucilaginibacter phenanthrenivorans TaxID=1234842 RepID=UPI0021572425|nr:AhpC/TSA family protein [Mucilaginibacter phenanthrenivorans]MCR8560611.1 AhpC/TSA family protein [Mucilaginibacter phenanthrenivorans]
MKKHLILSIVTILSLAVYSCKDKDAFTISGVINNPGSLKTIYLMEADSSTVAVIDSVNLSENGKFQFKHKAPYANLYKLRVGGSIFDMIAKNGDAIDFSTSLNDNTHAYEVSGSDESGKIKEFNKISNFYGEKNAKITQEYQDKAQAIGKESDSLIKIYLPMFQKNSVDYSNEILKFVNANKTSLAGFYAATSLDPSKYEAQMITYADDIKDNFKDNPGVQKFIKMMVNLKPVSVGHKAPDFTVAGIDGKPIKLSDYKGKYVMLDFWASWCAPCRAENPNVVKQYAIYKPLGLNILGISLDQDKAKWEQAIAADKLTWSHGSDLKNFEGPTERLFHVEAIPSNFIIDPQGIIVAKNITGADLEEFLNKTFTKSQQIVKIK